MNAGANNEKSKENAMLKIESINAVDGFDPMPLAMCIGNMNEGGVRYRLPVMAQMAWFRMKYPEGKLAVSVKPGKDAAGHVYFIAEARVYAHYSNPAECFLAEGSASRGIVPDKPTLSPREWAQTAAIGIALRNAGFGLQFAVAGESYEDNTLNELASMNISECPVNGMPPTAPVAAPAVSSGTPAEPPVSASPAAPTSPEPECSPLEKAMATPCPIVKYKGKTLGEMIRIDPKALAYIAKSGDKYSLEISEHARLICENALTQATA